MTRTIILEAGSTVESRTVQTAAMLLDEEVSILHVDQSRLHGYSDDIRHPQSLAVGSVEFMRDAFALAGVAEPSNMSYPPAAQPFLRRRVWSSSARDVSGEVFVKPQATKRFTGFVFGADMAAMTEHDRAELEVFRTLDPSEPVWASDVVQFLCEWRYYMDGTTVLGAARYDPDGDEGAPAPDQEIVSQLALALNVPHAYAIDVGVLSSGETALVEVNDAWALGFYRGAISPATYLSFLQSRWNHLRSTCSS